MSDQLSLLDYVPSPAEIQEPAAQPFRVGDRISGQTLSGKVLEGEYVGLSMSGMVQAQTDEPNRLNGLMLLIPDTVTRCESRPPINKQALVWREGKAALYLELIGRMMASQCLTPEVKRHEISRLHALRQQALAEIESLKNDCSS